MSEQPPLERLADLVFEWAMDEDMEQTQAEDFADSVQDLARDALPNVKKS